jgi:hypothetical protein
MCTSPRALMSIVMLHPHAPRAEGFEEVLLLPFPVATMTIPSSRPECLSTGRFAGLSCPRTSTSSTMASCLDACNNLETEVAR